MPTVAGYEVGPIGFGLMGLTWRPQPCSQEQAFAALRAALEVGCTYWNGGDFYGPPSYNSNVLLERYLTAYPDDADRFVLCSKGAIDAAKLLPDSSAASVRRSMDDCVSHLQGKRARPVDVFECARRDHNVPLAETLALLTKEYIEPGLLGAIGLSEVSAATIEEAVAALSKLDGKQKIAHVEVELSLWSTEVLTNGVVAACAKHDIPILAYAPIGRGMLTGQIKSLDDLPPDDMRHHYPRFHPDNFAVNLQLVEEVERLAKNKGCTPAQLAINWVRCLSKRPGMPRTIIPIPGATTAERVRENAVLVDLTDEEMDEIDKILAKVEIKGTRYPAGAHVDT